MTTTTNEEMTEVIAAGLFEHRLTLDAAGKPACACGWWVQPLLDSAHRLHQAEKILAKVTMATARLNAEHIAEALTGARELLREDCKARTRAVGLLLSESGDITPMGARMLDKIWEPAESNTPGLS